MNWFSIQHRNDEARVFVYGEIGIFGIGFDDFQQALEDAKTVDLHLDCPGGDSSVALKMATLLAERDTFCTITGAAYSSAITLALGAKTISCYSTARLMVHSPVAFVAGSPAELRQEAENLEKIIAPIAELYGRRCFPALVGKWFHSGDHWLDAEQALAVGLVDEIITAPVLPDRAAVTQPGADTAPNDSPTPDEAFVLDLLRITTGLKVRNRARLAQGLNVWLQSTREI